jgi:N-acetylmuramate 1-kinase
MLDDAKDAFIIKSLGPYQEAQKLCGDASTRDYYRIYRSDHTSYILCQDAQLIDRPITSYPYWIVYHLLRDHGIAVPELYAWESTGLLLQQDLGDELVDGAYGQWSDEQRRRVYQELIEIIVRIQSIRGPRDLLPFSLSFDNTKLMFEFEFFIEHFLNGWVRAEVHGRELEELRRAFIDISRALYRPDEFVLNHRDFISRNIIIYQNKPYLIDFQDARLGLPHYDLVSLLRDSEPRIDDALCRDLTSFYFELCSERQLVKMGREEFDYYFDLMAFQRNVKALGTFGYQVHRMKREKYIKYISPTFRYLSDYAERRKELRKPYQIIASYFEG